MPQSLSKVYVHIVFATKYRRPIIDDAIKERLWEYLGGVCKGLECNPVQIGGYKDHIHILCLLSRKITQMKLVEEVKKQSSKWIKTIDPRYANFYWQDGYGIFSVYPHEIDRVINYIKNQEAHHSKRQYKEELIAILKKYQVEYDERYLWD
jgi:REP element-mobilizing transposase RayT